MFEKEFGEWRDGGFAREGINSPVTIVEGPGRGGCGPGPTISLEQYTDYILRKFQQRLGWAESAGTWPFPGGEPPFGGPSPPFGPNMTFGIVSTGANVPLKAIGSVVLDALYLLTAGLVCKIPDAGAGTVTLTVTYYDVLAGSTTVTLSQVLTAAGKVDQVPIPVFLLGGSAVTVNVTNSGTYGVATYDAFVGLSRVG